MARRPALDETTLRALSRPQLSRWLFAAAVDWALIGLTFAVVARVHHPLGYALALLPLGSRQQALGALFHDAAHGLGSRSRAANDAAGSLLAAFPLGLTLGGYRRYHFAHHRLLGTEGDPEIAHKRGVPQWRLPARPARVALGFAGDLVGGGLPHLLAAGKLTRPVALGETAAIGLFWAAVLAGAAWLHALWVPALWIASVATVFWSGVRLRIWTEHLGTRDTHRIAVPGWLGHLIMPHHIGLHWEHHHYPGVPFWNLPALRAALPDGAAGAPPVQRLGALARAFLLSAPLGSGEIGDVIGPGGATPGEPPRPAEPRARSEARRRALGFAVHVALPLALGALVYLSCRRVLPRALGWYPWGGRLAGALPGRVVDVLPDAAWAYALGALEALLWRDVPGKARWFWIATAPLAAAGWELGQYAGVVPGTFDLADLVFGVAACGLAVLLCGRPAPGLDRPAGPASERV